MKDNNIYESVLDIENILPILNKISILAGLNDKHLYTLFRLLHQVTYKSGQTIFIQGEQPEYIYIVKKGKVKLIVHQDDTPLELIEFGQGCCFGEASVIGILPHKGTAIATADTELIVLSRMNLMSIYESDKELFSLLILNIAREACRRLHASDDILLHYLLKK